MTWRGRGPRARIGRCRPPGSQQEFYVSNTTYPEEGLLVDTHVHVFKQNMPLIPNPRHSPTYSFTVEQLTDVMDRYGVRYAVIAAASPGATTAIM